jgi:hypothetical protein
MAETADTADTVDAGDLVKLPLELRNNIYAHLLVGTKKIPIKRFVVKTQGY